MTDIVTRLRNPPFGAETSERNLMAAASDEIERLSREAESFRCLAGGLQLSRDQLSASRDKLLAETARLAAEVGKLETTLVAAAIEAKRAQRQRDEALEALLPFAEYITGRESRLGYREADDERMLREVTIGDFRRARSVLENSKAGLADATNNPVPLTLSDAGSDAEGRDDV